MDRTRPVGEITRPSTAGIDAETAKEKALRSLRNRYELIESQEPGVEALREIVVELKGLNEGVHALVQRIDTILRERR